MVQGYASDVNGDETVMDYPDATVRINLADLPPQQALAIAQETGQTDLSDEQRGRLADGKRLEDDYCDATFHLTLGQALSALAAIEAVSLPQEPPEEQEQQA